MESQDISKDVQRVLVSEEEIKNRVESLGSTISEDYKDKKLLMVSVLKGSIVFMSDLMRKITIPCRIDFMAFASYNGKAKSSGVVKMIKDLDIDITGYDILIVEDILDSGITLDYIIRLLNERNPKSIKICTLLDKPGKRKADIHANYIGFTIPDEFVIGYGLDYDEEYRNLPYVCIPKPHVYS